MTTVDTSLMDIGRHCHQCRQIDFLPFTCSFCKQVYCKDHQKPERHACAAVPAETSRKHNQYAHPPVLALFPSAEKHQQRLEEKFEASQKVPVELAVKKSALAKLRAMWKDKPKAGGKTARLLQIRKEARGDAKVGANDRVYVMVHHGGSESAVWVSKQWPVGKAVDSVVDVLKLGRSGKKWHLEGEGGKIEASKRVVNELTSGQEVALVEE